jgi:hypothetical protein
MPRERFLELLRQRVNRPRQPAPAIPGEMPAAATA